MKATPRAEVTAAACALALTMFAAQFHDANAVVLPDTTTAPAGVVLSSEVEDGAVGDNWSDEKVTSTNSSGNVHGPFGATEEIVSKTFEVTTAAEGYENVCTLKLRAWAIGDWEREYFEIMVDDFLVFDKLSGGSKGCLVTGWTIDPSGDFPGHETHHPACYYDVDVDVACDGPEVTVGVLADVDGDEDESWAFQNFNLIVTEKELMCADVVECDVDTILIDDADSVKLPRKEKNYQRVCCVIDPSNTCADVDCADGTKQVDEADTVQRPLNENRRQAKCCVAMTCADAVCDDLTTHVDDADKVKLPSNENRVQPICCVWDATCADAVCDAGTTQIDGADTIKLPRKDANQQSKCCVAVREMCDTFDCAEGTVLIDAADTVFLPTNAKRRQAKCCVLDPALSCAVVECAEGTTLVDGAETKQLPKKAKRQQTKCCK